MSGSATIGSLRHGALACATVLLLLACSSVPAASQGTGRGSRLVPVSDWSNEYVRLLRDRGYLPALNPLVQPYRAADVARALGRLDPDTLPEPAAGWVRLLLSEYGWRQGERATSASARWGGEVVGGARGSTSQRLDPLRPLGDADAWPRYTLGAWVETGPIAAEARLAGDMYLNDDPDGLDPGQRRGGRSDHAYVSADFGVASLVVGRFSRNWSRIGTRGLMVSDATTPYPQVGLELRAGRFALRSFLGELDTLGGRKRYVAAHRIDYATPNFVVSVGESNLHAPQSGGPSLRFLNPVEPLFFDHDNAPYDATQNLMLDAQVWYRLGRVVLFAEGLLDDIDVKPQGNDAEPTLYAFTVGSRLAALTSWADLEITYQQVSGWAYRTPNVIDRYSYLGRGLGENYSDYDRLTVAADLHLPVRGLRITPLIELQRQGEGNFRDSIPPQDEYLASPALFLGVRETTYRFGLRGRYQPTRFAWLAWDVGQSVLRNRDHVDGLNESEFTAVGEIGLRVPLPLSRPR